MNYILNESTVEEAALSWFEELEYAAVHSPNIASDEPETARESFGDVVLIERLHVAEAERLAEEARING